ncbi:MAG: YdcF family protein, partial [Pseudomonadota bacterium]|nr:YdcF family protein [Pseudomonadota bacterium]
CCAELEFAARDTRGNARAARRWAETNKLASLYLVTANYHMPRAKLTFEREMPHIDLHYWPVNPNDLHIDNWWTDPVLVRLLAREYAKFLAEFIRL